MKNTKLNLIGIWSISLLLLTQISAQTEIASFDFSSEEEFKRWTLSGVNSGPKDWEWSTQADEITSRFELSPFSSTTVANGFIQFDSDANGEALHDVRITSETIYLSPQTKVMLSFETLFAYFTSADTSIAEVGVSVDGGDYIYHRLFENLEENQTVKGLVDIEIPEATGERSIKIQFRWRGFFEYFWMIDDVKLYNPNQAPKIDLKGMVIPLNAATPLIFAQPVPLIAKVHNVGGPLFEETNLRFSVQDCSDSYSNGCSLFSENQQSLLDLGPDAVFVQANDPFVNESSEPFRYTLRARVNYLTSSSTESIDFAYSDTTFAKELSIDGENPDTYIPYRDFSPNNTNGYAYGNVFYVPTGGFQARYASFKLENTTALAGEQVDILLYAWEGDTNGDDQANPNEYEVVGKNTYVFSGSEPSWDFIHALVDQSGSVLLEGGIHYLLMIRQATNGTPMIFTTTDNWDYSSMMEWTKAQGAPHYAAALDIDNTNNFALTGDDVQKRVPLVRLSIGDAAIVSNREVFLPNHTFEVTPNPNRGKMNIKFNLDNSTATAGLQLVDLNGRTVWKQTVAQPGSQNLRIEPGALSAGVYFLRLQTSKGMLSKKIVIQP